jgi:hypothetical protein
MEMSAVQEDFKFIETVHYNFNKKLTDLRRDFLRGVSVHKKLSNTNIEPVRAIMYITVVDKNEF